MKRRGGKKREKDGRKEEGREGRGEVDIFKN